MNYYQAELYHYGIKNQKWGVRRFQNEDGSLTKAGQKRYGAKPSWQDQMKSAQEVRERQRAAKQQSQSSNPNSSNTSKSSSAAKSTTTTTTNSATYPVAQQPISIIDSLVSTYSGKRSGSQTGGGISYSVTRAKKKDSAAKSKINSEAIKELSGKKVSEVSVEKETIDKVNNLVNSISNETSKKKKTSSAYIGG